MDADDVDGKAHIKIITDKVKFYLQRKLDDTAHKIKKKKRKKRIIQAIAISTTVTSVVISAVVASVTIPPIAISILSASSAVLTGLNLRFNFQTQTHKLQVLIDKLNKIQSKLDYIVSCNGNLTVEELEQIMKEF